MHFWKGAIFSSCPVIILRDDLKTADAVKNSSEISTNSEGNHLVFRIKEK